MKKLLLSCLALLCATTMVWADASYGIAVNGKTYYAGTKNPTPGDPSFEEYMVLGLSLNAGDQFQLYDPNGNEGAGAGWAVDLDDTSTTAISRNGDNYTCLTAGCFDFYIKLKYGEDQLYVGDGDCGSPAGVDIEDAGQTGGNEGGNEGGSETDCADGPYALMVNGSAVGQFVDGGFAPDGETPQLNISASLKQGDVIAFNNTSCNALFFPQEIETGGEVDGSANFDFGAESATCLADGCYNFWWKKIYGSDKLYIGTDGNCGGGTGGGATSIEGFYLIGYWGGANHGQGEQVSAGGVPEYAYFDDNFFMKDCKWSGTFPGSDGGNYAWIKPKLKANGGAAWMFYSTIGFQGDGNKEMTFYSAKYLSEIGKDALSESWSVPANQKLNIIITVVSENEVKMALVDDATFAAHNCGSFDIGGGDNPTDPTDPDEPKPSEGDLFLLGNAEGNNYEWAANVGTKMNYNAQKAVYTITTTLGDQSSDYAYFAFASQLGEANDEAGWGVVNSHRFGPAESDTEVILGESMPLSANVDASFKIASGKYTITVDLNTLLMYVVAANGEEPTDPTDPEEPVTPVDKKVYMLGNIESNGFAWNYDLGTEMKYDAKNKVYTLTEFAQNNEGAPNAYFAFTTLLGSSWDETNANRLSPVEDGTLVEVGSKYEFSEDIEGQKAFMIPQGTYTFIVNLEENVLSVKSVSAGIESTENVEIRVVNGTIISDQMIQIFNIQGQDMTNMNGNLPQGLYMVRQGNQALKLFVR